MQSKLTVTISPPLHGSMFMQLAVGDQRVADFFSTRVHPFFEQLVGALRVLKAGFVDERILLFLGSPECELRMQAEVGSTLARLKVDRWPDSGRSKFGKFEELLRFEGQREEIALPFVEALKRIRAEVSDSEFQTGYGSAFPTKAYAALITAWE